MTLDILFVLICFPTPMTSVSDEEREYLTQQAVELLDHTEWLGSVKELLATCDDMTKLPGLFTWSTVYDESDESDSSESDDDHLSDGDDELDEELDNDDSSIETLMVDTLLDSK